MFRKGQFNYKTASSKKFSSQELCFCSFESKELAEDFENFPHFPTGLTATTRFKCLLKTHLILFSLGNLGYFNVCSTSRNSK